MLPLLTVFLGGHGAPDLPSLLVWPLLILSFKSPGLSATTQRTHSFLCPAPSVHLSLTQRYSRQPVLLVWFSLLQKFLWSQFPQASYSHGFADVAPSGFLQPWPQSSDIPIYLFCQNFLIFNRLLAFFTLAHQGTWTYCVQSQTHFFPLIPACPSVITSVRTPNCDPRHRTEHPSQTYRRHPWRSFAWSLAFIITKWCYFHIQNMFFSPHLSFQFPQIPTVSTLAKVMFTKT